MNTNYQVIKKEDLYYLPASTMHPADTYFHFSFAGYHDPDNMNFGVLRVFNDDEVRPESGFGRHPHSDMEIVSYVVSGALTHWDSATGKEEVLKRGDVQAITAGTGVMHSEMNNHENPCRFLQIWIIPPAKGLPVRYGIRRFEHDARRNRLLHIVGNPGNRERTSLYLHQDVNLYVAELTDPGRTVDFTLKAGRQAYVNCIEGSLHISGGLEAAEQDSLKLVGQMDLTFSSPAGQGHLMIIEMPESR